MSINRDKLSLKSWLLATGLGCVVVAVVLLLVLLPKLPGGYRVTRQIDKSRVIVDAEGQTVVGPLDWHIESIATGKQHFVVQQVRTGPNPVKRWVLVDTISGPAIEHFSQEQVRAVWTERGEGALRFRDVEWFE